MSIDILENSDILIGELIVSVLGLTEAWLTSFNSFKVGTSG
jgi:hypothetical protein